MSHEQQLMLKSYFVDQIGSYSTEHEKLGQLGPRPC